MALPHPQWCCRPLLWRDTGQVSDGRPGSRQCTPPRKTNFLPHLGARLSQCLSHSAHSELRHQAIYIHTSVPREATPTCFQTPVCMYLAYRRLERSLPVSTPTHKHDHSTLHTPSYKEHVNTCIPAHPETCTQSYSLMCTQCSHPQSTHIHTHFHTRVFIQTHICSTTTTRTVVCRVAYPDGRGPHENAMPHVQLCTHTNTLSPASLKPVYSVRFL